MKTRSILIAVLASTFLLTGSALAQDVAPRQDGTHQHHHHGRFHRDPARRLEMLTAILGLDEHQAAGVRQIFEANRPRREQIRAMTDETQRHAAMLALHQETRAQIDALLTPDQRATLDRMEAVRREHGPRGRGGRGDRAPSAPTGI